jgi:hypothetical protein
MIPTVSIFYSWQGRNSACKMTPGKDLPLAKHSLLLLLEASQYLVKTREKRNGRDDTPFFFFI